MAKEQSAIDILRSMIGAEGKPAVIELEEGLIRKFVDAIDDHNPLWQNRINAQNKKNRDAVPPYVFCSPMLSGRVTQPELPLPYNRILDGGIEWEFLRPAMSGDTITSVNKFIGFQQREGKSGHMLLLNFKVTHRNQKGELVAKICTTLINLQ